MVVFNNKNWNDLNDKKIKKKIPKFIFGNLNISKLIYFIKIGYYKIKN